MTSKYTADWLARGNDDLKTIEFSHADAKKASDAAIHVKEFVLKKIGEGEITTNQKGFVNIIVLVIIVALVGVVGYFALRTPTPVVQEQTPSPIQTTNTPPPSVDETSTWKTYRNEKYGFEVKYPPGWYKNFEGGNGHLEFASFPQTAYSHGGIRPSLGMTVVIGKGICNKSSDTWQRQEYIANFGDIEKIICPGGFQFALTLDENDPKVIEHEQLLEIIANTFKFIPSR